MCLAVALMGASGVQCSATICPVLPKGSIYIRGELAEAAFAVGRWRVSEIVSETARNKEELIFCLYCGGGVDLGRSEV